MTNAEARAIAARVAAEKARPGETRWAPKTQDMVARLAKRTVPVHETALCMWLWGGEKSDREPWDEDRIKTLRVHIANARRRLEPHGVTIKHKGEGLYAIEPR